MSESLAAWYEQQRDLDRSRRARAREQKKSHQRSAQARAAAIVSVAARRELAARRRAQQLSRRRHAERYRKWCADHGRATEGHYFELGRETNWQIYTGLMRWGHRYGRQFETTNRQQADGLSKRGRTRCTRTVQRHRAILADLGLAHFHHIRRGGATAGFRDSLRVRVFRFMSPPYGAGGGREPLQGSLYPPPAQPSSAPPIGGRPEPPPAAAGNGSDERSGGEAIPAAVAARAAEWEQLTLRLLRLSP